MKVVMMLRLLVCLGAVVVFCTGGCVSNERVEKVQTSYRTVQAAPLRNTDKAKAANQRGLAHLDKGELDEAAKAFSAALEQDIDFGPAHNNLGKVYYAQGDWYRAAWEFEYARKLLPRRAEPRNNLGLVLELDGRLDDAVNYYREAVSLAPGNIEFRANLARTLIRRGERTQEVRDLLKQILAEDTRAEWLIWAKFQLTGTTPQGATEAGE